MHKNCETIGAFVALTGKLFGVYCLIVFATLGLLTFLPIAVMPGLVRRRRIAHRSARLLLALTGMMPRTVHSERLPQASCIIVANHASYLDGIILTAVLPPRFGFVIKAEVQRVPLIGFVLRRIGSHFVDRIDPRRAAMDARGILRSANSRESLAIFPEGTFDEERGLKHFRKGAFSIASRSGLPLVPAVISGSRDVLSAERILPRRGRLSVTLLEAIDTSGGSAEELCLAARGRILQVLDEPDLGDDPNAPEAEIGSPAEITDNC